MIARVRVLVHGRERVRGHGAPGTAKATGGGVVVMGLQRRGVAVVLRGAAMVMLVGGRGRGGRKVWMGVRVRVVDAAHVVRVLLELDERRLGRGYGRYAAARVLATAGCVIAAAARAVCASGTTATAGSRAAARAQRGGVHGVTTAGHRGRCTRGPLLLLLVSASTAAPSERASDLSVIQRDGRPVQRSGGKINRVPRDHSTSSSGKRSRPATGSGGATDMFTGGTGRKVQEEGIYKSTRTKRPKTIILCMYVSTACCVETGHGRKRKR